MNVIGGKRLANLTVEKNLSNILERPLVIAKNVRSLFSGRFKAMLNFSEQLNCKILVSGNENLPNEIDILGAKNAIFCNPNNLEKMIFEYNPTFILFDDKHLDFLSLEIQAMKVVYVYPITALWPTGRLSLQYIQDPFFRFKIEVSRYLPSNLFLKKYKLLHSKADVVIAQSHTVSGMLRYYYKVDPDLVLYNPVNRSIFKPEGERINLVNRKSAVLYLGSGPGDTYTDLLNPIVNSLNKNSIEVWTFGNKNNLEFIEDFKNVKYFKNISDIELARLYSESLFSITPQYDEPAGYVPIESISCGTPVISTYPDEAIVNGYTGYTASKKNFLKLIKELLESELYVKMRQNCRNHSSMFDAGNLTSQLTDYITIIYKRGKQYVNKLHI
jgi:glycosyltransferase involved in cell wall biosynthesis